MDKNLTKKIAPEAALEAALEAGEILRGGINSHKDIGRKSSAVDLITQYDHQAEAVIVNKLQESFPDHNIVAEESDWNNGVLTTVILPGISTLWTAPIIFPMVSRFLPSPSPSITRISPWLASFTTP